MRSIHLRLEHIAASTPMAPFYRVLVLFSLAATALPAFAAPTFYTTEWTASDKTNLSNWSVATNRSGNDAGFSDFPTNGEFKAVGACDNIPTGWGSSTNTRANWIANQSNCSNGGSNGNFAIGNGNWTQFIFRQSFTLTPIEASSLQLTFQWAADDSGLGKWVQGSWIPKWSLNSLAQADLVAGIWGASDSWPGSTYALGPAVTISGFNEGVNTMYFWVQGNGVTDGMSLMNAQFSSRNVPEPATFGLLGLGLLGVTMSRRRATVSA